jgi:hypothetical protein
LGVIDSYATGEAAGRTGTNGVANKFGVGSVFGGHFQANDHITYAAPTDVTAICGFESNIQAKGLDHPTGNNNLGFRVVASILARSLGGPGTAAEIGVGMMIKCDAGTDSNGYFRAGLALYYNWAGNPSPMGTAIDIRTSGTKGINLRGSSAVGLDLSASNFTTAAIRLKDGQYIELDGGVAYKMRFAAGGNDKLQFISGASERLALNIGVSPHLALKSVKVVGQRETGWTAATGPALKAAFASYAGQTHTASYVQSTVQALDDETKNASQRVKAIKDALRTHGLIN